MSEHIAIVSQKGFTRAMKFDSTKYSVEQAITWLTVNGYKIENFEAAESEKAGEPAAAVKPAAKKVKAGSKK
jgi:hypothetical protein